jgi:hypothetical protein
MCGLFIELYVDWYDLLWLSCGETLAWKSALIGLLWRTIMETGVRVSSIKKQSQLMQ